MKISIRLLSIIIVFSSVSMYGMKQFKKTSQLFLQHVFKKTEKISGLNFKKFTSNLELEKNNQFKNFSTLSSNIAFESDIEKKEDSKQLVSVIKNNNRYKGFDKNTKFQLYSTTKRNFHTNKQLQGPILGLCAYWVVKGGCYAVMLATAGAAVATASAPLIAAGGATALAGGAAATGAAIATEAAIGSAIASTAIAGAGAAITTGGATIAAGGIAAAGGAALATEATLATVTAAGGVASTIAWIEAAALAAQAACTCAPTV